MTILLILSSNEVSASLLADTATAAGFAVARPDTGEDLNHAADRVQADILLVDIDATVPPDLYRGMGHVLTLVVLVSNVLSPYELAAVARSRGVAHFNHSGGPAALARAVGDAATLARLPVERRPVAAAAAASVRRAHDLAARAGDVLATANELRIANRIALAACRMNRQLLHETVVACARDLRRMGMDLDLVVELVTSAVEGSALDHPASRAEVEAEAEAAAQWAIDAWRAA